MSGLASVDGDPTVPRRSEARRSVKVVAITAVVGFVILAAVLAGLGFLLTDVLVDGSIGRWDVGVSEWFVAERTASWDEVSAIGSTIGSTIVIVAGAAVAVLILAIRRFWREVGLIVIALAVEVSVFLLTTLLVDRPRPDVPRLDVSPPTASFPSGHTAAAIALYVSFAIVMSTHVRNATIRITVWVVGIALPVFVALSRLYRGMHHPTDVIGSIVLGAGALLIATLAVRLAAPEPREGRGDEEDALPIVEHAETASVGGSGS